MTDPEARRLQQQLRDAERHLRNLEGAIALELWDAHEAMPPDVRKAIARLHSALTRHHRREQARQVPGQIDMIDLLNQPSTPEEPR